MASFNGRRKRSSSARPRFLDSRRVRVKDLPDAFEVAESRGHSQIERRTVLEHHQQWTLSAVVCTVAHVVVIASDGYVDISVRGALVPGQSAHLAGAVAIGTLALWGLAVLMLSSWLRAFMSFTV